MAIHIVMAKHPLTSGAYPYTVILLHHREECCQRIIQDLVIINTTSVITGVFPMAQTLEPILFVLSAWAHKHTMSMCVKDPRHGTDATQCLLRETKTNYMDWQQTQQQTYLLWMWSSLSWSLCLSSNTKSLDCLLPTVWTFRSLNYKKKDTQENILMLWQASILVFQSIFPRSSPSKHPLISILSSSSQKDYW